MAHRCLSSHSVRKHPAMVAECVCVFPYSILSSYIAFLASLSPHSEAFVLHLIIPLLQSGVQKREKPEFYNNHFPLL